MWLNGRAPGRATGFSLRLAPLGCRVTASHGVCDCDRSTMSDRPLRGSLTFAVVVPAYNEAADISAT